MPVILTNGAVFMHVPKTGGTWVTKVLDECGLIKAKPLHKHADAYRSLPPFLYRGRKLVWYYVKRKLGLIPPGKPFMFCFVRHPIGWYESYYRYMSAPKQAWRHWGDEHDPDNWHPCSALNRAAADDFNDFIRNVIRLRPGFVSEMYGWYTPPFVDFVGRQEYLAEDLIKALKMMGLAVNEDFVRNYPRVHTSQSVPLKWDPELKKEILRLEYVALVRFGYLDDTRNEV